MLKAETLKGCINKTDVIYQWVVSSHYWTSKIRKHHCTCKRIHILLC